MSDKDNRWPCHRMLKAGVLAIIGILILTLVIRLSTVFIPVAVALLLAYILEPLITFMDRHHSRRVVTVPLAYAFFVVLLLGVGVLIGPPLFDQGRDFVSFIKDKNEEYGLTDGMWKSENTQEKEAEGWWGSLFSDDEKEAATDDETDPSASDLEEGEEDGEEDEAVAMVGNLMEKNASMIQEKMPVLAVGGAKAIVTGAGNVATFVTQFFLALFYAFFFMLHFPALQKASTDWIPRAHKKEAEELLGEIDDVVAGFFRGRLLVCVISAVVTSLGLFISGIDFWLLLGVSAGFLGIIPFIGVTLTLIPSLLMAFTSPESVFAVVGVLITFAIVQGFVEPFIGPFVISSKVRLHPVTVTIAFMAGGVLFGILGLLLAIPACGILKILSKRYLLPAVDSVILNEQ